MKFPNNKWYELKLFTLCNLTRLFWIVLCSFIALSSVSINAQEREWWFDIELIVYKRNIAPNDVMENFEPTLQHINTQGSMPLLRDYIRPDVNYLYQSLPVCFAPPKEVVELEVISEHDIELPDAPYIPELAELASLPEDAIELQSAGDGLIDSQEPESNFTVEALPVAVQSGTLTESIAEIAEEVTEFNYAALSVWLDAIIPAIIQVPSPMLCRYNDEKAGRATVAKVPKSISGLEWPSLKASQLLSVKNLQLNEFARDINRQRGLSVMTHMGWRQQVFVGQENATPLHLFAGTNYADSYHTDGTLLPPEVEVNEAVAPLITSSLATDGVDGELNNAIPDQNAVDALITETAELTDEYSDDKYSANTFNLVDEIRNALNNDKFQYNPAAYVTHNDDKIEPLLANALDASSDHAPQREDLWELDGNLKIFLRYIGRTPYLHIDGELDFRAPVFDKVLRAQSTSGDDTVNTSVPVVPDRLQSYPFEQLRRVISQQVHYFDHPMFGMVIQIRRYEFPKVIESAQSDTQ